MDDVTIDLPARRTAWRTDRAYQLRLTERARHVAAAAWDVLLTRLRLAVASMPDTHEDAQLAERDEARVRFTFCTMEMSGGQVSQRRRPRRAA